MFLDQWNDRNAHLRVTVEEEQFDLGEGRGGQDDQSVATRRQPAQFGQAHQKVGQLDETVQVQGQFLAKHRHER